VTAIPNPESLELLGGQVGVLILSGFEDSFEPLTAWALALHQTGHTVILPHWVRPAADWKHLKHASWRRWEASVEEEFRKLKLRCEKVFIASYQVGGALALYLVEKLGDEVEGLILLEPSLPIRHKLFPQTWRAIELDLYLIDQPILIMYPPGDRIHKPNNILTIVNEVSSPFLREILIENSRTTFSNENFPLIVEESLAFINEVTSGVWLTDIETGDDDADLIDAEFQSIIAGLSLDESTPTTYLDELERDNPEDHFEKPDPELLPIADSTKRNAIVAMVLGPVYAILAAATGFNPFGIEPWPGIVAFFGGLAVFLYRLRDDDVDDDGAVL
jgi:carboxylesterase